MFFILWSNNDSSIRELDGIPWLHSNERHTLANSRRLSCNWKVNNNYVLISDERNNNQHNGHINWATERTTQERVILQSVQVNMKSQRDTWHDFTQSRSMLQHWSDVWQWLVSNSSTKLSNTRKNNILISSSEWDTQVLETLATTADHLINHDRG